MNEFYGGADKVPFLKMDCTNMIGHQRKKYLESNDTQTLPQKMLSPTAYHRGWCTFATGPVEAGAATVEPGGDSSFHCQLEAKTVGESITIGFSHHLALFLDADPKTKFKRVNKSAHLSPRHFFSLIAASTPRTAPQAEGHSATDRAC